MLFLPWRDENELIEGFSSYEAKFKSIYNDPSFDIESFSSFKINKEKIEKAIDYAKELKEINIEISSNESCTEDDYDIIDVKDTFLEIPESKDSPEDLNEKLKHLNKEQLELFNDIIESIFNQENNFSKEAINIFCSGVAGKTFIQKYFIYV